ncbi:hypothetical protein [Bacillus sp. B15-48]|uniref:hypothetical protein n=1 Tax=Bacillus sp. B15-48 TaxID=1548601 RepID=UPI00193F1EF3|nr:hypothetical protein [Bacillus sp. B15-48]MBM4762804.1 hypothetical protein [Bacillus sp. B15-48]
MTVFVYQTFEIKQENFKDAMENLHELQKFRNEHYDHEVELLSPIVGQDHTYALLSKYDGLAELELQDKRMFDDEKYLKLIGDFFLKNIVQGSLHTQIYRTTNGKTK